MGAGLNNLAQRCYDQAADKGFHDNDKNSAKRHALAYLVKSKHIPTLRKLKA